MTDVVAPTDVSDPGLVGVEPLLRAMRLRNMLRVNAVVSGIAGLVAAVAASVLGDLLGVASTAARVVGIGLVVFAVSVAWRAEPAIAACRFSLASSASPTPRWVMATVPVVASGTLTALGVMVATLVGMVVANLGVLEVRGAAAVRAAGPAADAVPPLEAISVVADVEAPPERAWAVVTDHELYGRLAPNLGRVEITAANGPGLARRCYDGRGRGWNESCTLWDEGRRFAVAVDTSDYPYPLQIMRGSWSVDPVTAGRSRFGMTFVFQPRPSVGGRAFAWMMQAAFPVVLHRILRGWREAAVS